MIYKGFQFINVNTRSICKKIELIKNLYDKADVICCTETWLDNRILDSIVKIDNMNLFRCDRRNNITDYNVHIIGGGVCIYLAKKWYDFSTCIPDCTLVNQDFEILSITIQKPQFRKLFISCIYKPPKGSINNLIKFLTEKVEKYKRENYEIWIMGDLNTDILKRDNINTINFNRFMKKTGLKQLINGITRPNVRGGSCIDLIMTDSPYVLEFGILDDLIADHYTTSCIRKKKRERHDIVTCTVRDYRAFDENVLENTLLNKNWDNFNVSIDPDIHWEIILSYVLDILSIMCPYKKVQARKIPTPWLTAEINKAIREKKTLVKLYKKKRDPITLRQLKIKINYVNSLIEKAKASYIIDMLKTNKKKPKRFWKLLKNLTDNNDCVDITSYSFKQMNSEENVERERIPDFLNLYFANVAEMTRTTPMNVDAEYITCYNNVLTQFDFVPPPLEDIYGYMMDIDICSSSCVNGVNAKICKAVLDKIPSKFQHLFANSLYTGKFPEAWTCSYVTLIPKEGNKNTPGNWRPISQTIVYAKILEKIVHKQVLKYLIDNILSKFQYGFLPEKSTHEAIFNTVRHMYSSINQNKLMGLLFLDIAKAFNCIDHNLFYCKLRDIGMCERVIDWFRSYLRRSQIVRYGECLSKGLVINYGEGGATKWENRGSETFCATPSRQGKTFRAPPFKEWKLYAPPPTIWLKLQATA